MENQFLNNSYKGDTLTENGAISNSSTGDLLLNQFSKAATFVGRDEKDVFADMSQIWGENPSLAFSFVLYLRMITRKTKGFFESESVQMGQGVRDESFKRLKWIAKYHPTEFNKNMWLIPVVGTWKDLWSESLINVIARDQVYELVAKGIQDPYMKDLVAKYLPRIKSGSNTTNDRHKSLNVWARGLCKYLGWNEKQYRVFKSTGKAHDFQRKISGKLFDEISWKEIPGKALFNITQSRGRKDQKTFLERHNLETSYLKWLETQPTAKFTGYVYELFKKTQTNMSLAQKLTIDKQFDGLLALAKQNSGGIKENVWCALDTSGSMESRVVGDISALDICVSLGIFFSSLNEGAFKDHVIMFDSTSRKLKLSGTFTDKAMQVPSDSMGSTNFQSVIDEIVRIKISNPNIPIEDFPTTLLICSDMSFNNSGSDSNYNVAMQKLSDVGLPKMKIIWWFVTGRAADFPSTIDDEGVTIIGGFDPSVVSLIIGGEQTKTDEKTGETRQLKPLEQMMKALNQDTILQVKI